MTDDRPALRLDFTPAQIAVLRDVCGLPPGDAEPTAGQLLAAVTRLARQVCGLRDGDRPLAAGDVAAVTAALEVLDAEAVRWEWSGVTCMCGGRLVEPPGLRSGAVWVCDRCGTQFGP